MGFLSSTRFIKSQCAGLLQVPFIIVGNIYSHSIFIVRKDRCSAHDPFSVPKNMPSQKIQLPLDINKISCSLAIIYLSLSLLLPSTGSHFIIYSQQQDSPSLPLRSFPVYHILLSFVHIITFLNDIVIENMQISVTIFIKD